MNYIDSIILLLASLFFVGSSSEPTATFSDDLVMDVPLGGSETLTLNLHRSAVINASIPVYLGTGRNSFTRWQGDKDEDFIVYEDEQGSANFIMWSTGSGADNSAGMRGVFQDGEQIYYIEPEETRQEISHDPIPGNPESIIQNTTVINVNNMKVTLSKVNRNSLESLEYEQRVTNETEEIEQKIRDFMQEVKDQGHSFPRYSYEVELLLVVDYAVFAGWMSRSRQVDYRSREAEAIKNIRFYFAHILQGVSQRYYSVEDFSMQIRIRPVAIYICKTPEASYFTEGAGIKEDYRYTEAYKALDAFEEWINRKDNKLPAFDQATLFTSNLLFSGYYNGRRRTISGLADIKSVCDDKRAAIVRDFGIYGGIQTAAHEIAHNLGAMHDGYDNSCFSKDQFIMATSPGVLDEYNRKNPYSFSHCSKVDFYEYLLMLTQRSAGNCLLHRNNTESWDYQPELQTAAGERYSADEQCKQIIDSQSFYCGGGDNDVNICSNMFCWDASEAKCKATNEQRAYDHTPCGDRKWCVNHACVYDSRAPPAAVGTCVYGDWKGAIDGNSNCKELGIRTPDKCYDEGFRSKCCATCMTIEKKDQPNCKFGDRLPDYCRRLNKYDCYDSNARTTCCQTCARLNSSIVGCEFGDKRSDCPSMFKGRCYGEADVCCDTCRSAPAGATPGCEWGNKFSWCSTISINDCANPVNRQACCERCRGYTSSTTRGYTSSTTTVSTNSLSPRQPCTGPDQSKDCRYIIPYSGYCYGDNYRCCGTCAQYLTGRRGCEYGDKFSWCASYITKYPDLCTRDPSIQTDCCTSCSAVSNKATTMSSESCQDTASWCTESINASPGLCYNPLTEQICCSSCRRHARTSATCKYGDHAAWCSKGDFCKNDAKYCCGTCNV